MIFITFLRDKDHWSGPVIDLHLYISIKVILKVGRHKGSMKNRPSVPLTRESLQELKDKGFLFVLVKGYSLERRVDYIHLTHFMLTPVRELPEDPGDKEIFAPIDSDVLWEWAGAEEVVAFIETAT